VVTVPVIISYFQSVLIFEILPEDVILLLGAPRIPLFAVAIEVSSNYGTALTNDLLPF